MLVKLSENQHPKPPFKSKSQCPVALARFALYIPAAGTLGAFHGGGVLPPEGHGDLCQLPLAVDVVIVHIGQAAGTFIAGAQQTQGLLYDPAALLLCGILDQIAFHLTSPGSPAPGR